MTRKTKKSSTTRLTGLQCIFAAFLLVLTVSTPNHAGLMPMDNTQLESVTGTGGFSIAVKNVQIFHHIETYRYCASDNGYIEFQDFLMHGIGNPAKFNFDYGFGSVTDSGIIHYDVFETEVGSINDWDLTTPSDAYYRGMISTIVPNWDQELGFTIGNLAFYDPNYSASPVDLGSLTMGLIDMPRFATYISPRIGGSGFDWQTNFQMTIDKIGYAYNDTCDAIELCPTYIGGDFTSFAGDNPAVPSSWAPNNNTDFGEFQIGDLFGDTTSLDPDVYASNPAMMDVAEGDIYGDDGIPGNDDDYTYGFVSLRLPMEGSIRFESATWYNDRDNPDPLLQSVNFGPGAIDGLQVHRLDLKMIP